MIASESLNGSCSLIVTREVPFPKLNVLYPFRALTAFRALSLPFPARAAIACSNVSYVPIENPFLEAKKEAIWHTISPRGPWYKRCVGIASLLMALF